MPTVEEVNNATPHTTEVLRLIHEGGQRVVFEALVESERRVLKLMPADGRARAEREVQIGRTFNHPKLSRVLDDALNEVEIGGAEYVYFTETYVEGSPLSSREGLMSPCEALE